MTYSEGKSTEIEIGEGVQVRWFNCLNVDQDTDDGKPQVEWCEIMESLKFLQRRRVLSIDKKQYVLQASLGC